MIDRYDSATSTANSWIDAYKSIARINNMCTSMYYGGAYIDSYEKAMNFESIGNRTIIISDTVLVQLVDRIKELEELNAKNWSNILEGDKE